MKTITESIKKFGFASLGIAAIFATLALAGCGGGGTGQSISSQMTAQDQSVADSQAQPVENTSSVDETSTSNQAASEVQPAAAYTAASKVANTSSGYSETDTADNSGFVEAGYHAAAAKSYFGPIFLGTTEVTTNNYKIGDWLNEDSQRNLISVQVVDDASGAFKCDVLSGKGIGTINTIVQLRLQFAPKSAGAFKAALKATWRTVPSKGTGVLKSAKLSISGYAADLQIEAVKVNGKLAQSFLPDDTLRVELRTAPNGKGGKMPADCLKWEWFYTDGSKEVKIGTTETYAPTETKICTLSGGIDRNLLSFKSHRGVDFTSPVLKTPNAPIGVHSKATLTLNGVTKTVEVFPSPNANGLYFSQDKIDQLRQEYWDFNQNASRRQLNNSYEIPDRTEIGVAAGSTYGVEVIKRKGQGDTALSILNSLVPVKATSRYHNPRQDMAIDGCAKLQYGPHIYGNAVDVTGNMENIKKWCKSLGWIEKWGPRTGVSGGKCYWMVEGDHIHIVF